ncbi:twin-arginine translocase subunit TatC [Microbacterium flavum]|nr:twin-arginine translocase subunit TatC [Microbacterium flavum]
MTTAAARGTMPLADHLREARTRAFRAAAALIVGLIVGYLLSDLILEVLRAPIEALAASRDASLNYDSITGAFDLKLRIALLTGIVVSSPVWLFEILRYLSPGLTRRERRLTLGYTFAAVGLFAVGAAFGFALFPHMVALLTGFASAQDSTILAASTYVDFVLKTVVATGLAFMLPVLVVLLNALRVISAATLRRSWRLITVAIVLFSAMVTPAADVLSMFLVALPMAALFGAAMLITHLHDRRLARRLAVAAEPAASLPA